MNEGAAGRTRGEIAAVAAVLAAVALAELDVARSLSLTYDERAHIGAGVAYIEHGEVLLNREHPPLVKLLAGGSLVLAGVREASAGEHYRRAQAAPERALFEQWSYATRLIFHDNRAFSFPFAAAGGDSVVTAARAPLVAFPVLLCLFAFLWGRSLFGRSGALVALGLAATYPDLLGHGALVTTDVPVAAFALGAGYALDGLFRRGGIGKLVLFGLAAGGALASKFSGPILTAAFLAVALVAAPAAADPAAASLAHPFGRGPAGRRALSLALAAALAAALALAVLAPTYLGAEPLSAYRRGLATLSANHSPAARTLCLGEYGSRCWYYFPAVAALKLPLGTLALLVLAAVASLRVRRGFAAECVLHVPAVVLCVATSAVAARVGSRYLLPVIPFLLVSAGRLAPWARGSAARWALVGLGIAASCTHALLNHPFHASATNAFAGDPRFAYRLIDDSNQDWGQGLEALAAWQRRSAARPLAVLPRFPLTDETELAAYGVDGRVVPREQPVLFLPRDGFVYAVSAHLVAWGRGAAMEAAERPNPPGTAAPRLALGGAFEPDEIVGGGFLIFDRRGPRSP